MADDWGFLQTLFGAGWPGGGGGASQPQTVPEDTYTTANDPTRVPVPPAAPPTGLGGGGVNQSLIGLGLGLLGGTPFNRYGPALQGYMAGARSDIAARQAQALNAYRQAEIQMQ